MLIISSFINHFTAERSMWEVFKAYMTLARLLTLSRVYTDRPTRTVSSQDRDHAFKPETLVSTIIPSYLSGIKTHGGGEMKNPVYRQGGKSIYYSSWSVDCSVAGVELWLIENDTFSLLGRDGRIKRDTCFDWLPPDFLYLKRISLNTYIEMRDVRRRCVCSYIEILYLACFSSI